MRKTFFFLIDFLKKLFTLRASRRGQAAGLLPKTAVSQSPFLLCFIVPGLLRSIACAEPQPKSSENRRPNRLKVCNFGPLGVSRGGFGASWAAWRRGPDAFRAHLGAFRGRLGAALGRLGAVLGRPGSLLGGLGGAWGSSWGAPGRSWAVLGASWRALWASWAGLL